MKQALADEQRLTKTAVKAFRQRWRKIVRDIEEGRKDYVNGCYLCFEADTSARQKMLAKRFYGIEHARKMAALGGEAIKENLSCYLPKAIEYAIRKNVDEPKEQEAFMRALVGCEYVIFDSHCDDWFEDYDEDTDDVMVSEYPSRVAYDDWYERSVGASLYPCSTSILMKSTGEPFTKSEVRWLKRSIRKNIDGSDISALWWFTLESIADNKIWVRIHEYTERDDYVEEFLREAQKMTESQFREFIRRMLEYLSEDKKVKRKIGVFKNYTLMNHQDLFDLAENFILSCVEADLLYEWNIRAIEDMMLSITGRADKNYHK